MTEKSGYKEIEFDDKDQTKVKRIDDSFSPTTFTILIVVAFYWICSLSVVFLNKYILSSSESKFPFPLLVTWFQLIVALVLLIVFGFLGKSIKMFSMVTPYEMKLELARKIVPLSIVYVMMLAMNNICLQYVEVTFYQVARSLTIVFQLLFTYLFLNQKTSSAATFSCFVVFIGFVLGSYGEMNFSVTGLVFGVFSSVFVALYGIYVKKQLQIVNNDQWVLLGYNTTIAIVLLFPLIVISGEYSDVVNSVTPISGGSRFWWIMIFSGITGFLINISVFLQIKYTTPLTNVISATAKACFQTLLAWIIYQNIITATNGIGILITLFGSGLYSYVRYKEMNR